MKKLGLILFLIVTAARLSADTIINPIDDGAIYGLAPSPNVVVDSNYVLTSGYIRGALLFGAFDTSVNSTYYLALNPYGLPIGDYTVDVYGYSSTSATILGTDYDKGVFVGTLTIPLGVGYGQDSLLDVTSFVEGSNSPYFGFILRTDGTDVFSSTEYNYGSPSRLVGVPDSASWAVVLGMTSVFLAAGWQKQRARG